MATSIFARLDPVSLKRLRHSAREAQKIETKWDIKIKRPIEGEIDRILKHLEESGKPPELDLESLLIEHYFDVTRQAIRIATEEEEFDTRPTQRLALPKPRIPESLKKLKELYDKWRKGQYTPRRPKKIATQIQRAYLERIQDVWQKHSEDFRSGDVATQREVVKEIKKAMDTTVARAQTVIRTETTNYYNQARRDYYDESQDVTHYLFMAVRDAATTPWCTPNTINGMRGRHGLVYKKGSLVLTKETPGCHWNCRSELLPLSPLNPYHLKLIKDASIQRANVECFPLPRNWNS